MEDLRKQMVYYRAKHKLTQKDLAERVGVSLQTINSIETGSQTPSAVTVAKIKLVIEQ